MGMQRNYYNKEYKIYTWARELREFSVEYSFTLGAAGGLRFIHQNSTIPAQVKSVDWLGEEQQSAVMVDQPNLSLQ